MKRLQIITNRNPCDLTKTVSVYRNLHKQCFSVKQGSKVCMHVSSILLENVTYVVNKKGRLRVLQEKRKNVHAYVRGRVYVYPYDFTFDMSKSGLVYYNPYKFDSFVLGDETPIRSSEYCYMRFIDGKPAVTAYNYTEIPQVIEERIPTWKL